MGPLESIASARSRGRCADCRAQVAGVLGGFAHEFSRALEAGELSTSKKQSLWEEVARANVPQQEAARFLQASMRRGIEASLKQMKERDDVAPEEGALLRESAVAAGMEPARVERIQARFEQLLGISQIRRGQLPAVVCDLVLEWDEVCHLNVDALYHKSRGRSKSASVVVGRLVATSRAIHFLSDEGGWTIQYRNVLRVTRGLACIGLELSARGGNGTYNVADPLRCQAVLTALTRQWKRHIMEPPAGFGSRHIAQEVKVAVWQRDGAQCVACGARDYLEFDHIIPHSKGGASTLGNVQLLCRKCNGAKGARI